MTNRNLLTLALALLTIFSCGQSNNKTPKDTKAIIKSDTLKVPYTYWWTDSGPFIGMCGEKYALVFLGRVTRIHAPIQDSTSLYIPQEGLIEILEILEKSALAKEKYSGQKYFSSDCFYGSEVEKGDTVMIFCYEYEGRIAIPGSIVKIDGFDAPIVRSIKKYIEADQNPIVIKEDMELWNEKGFGNALQQIIECKENLIND